MAEQVRSGSAELTPRSLVETFTKQKSAREESCAQCTTRADFFALLDYTDHEKNDQYCTSCLDHLIEQGGPIVRSMVEIDWPSTAPDDAIPVTKQELMSILSGGPAVVGRARRVVTMHDGPFVVVERHHGPGAHPGTGTPQEAHAEGGMVSPTTGARFVMATGEDQDARLLDWHPESQSLVWVRPEDYLQAVADDMGPAFGERDSRRSVIREEGIDRLKDRMRDGKPIDALWVDFELNDDQSGGQIVSQEGRHRAWAAIDLGVPYVPVITYFRPEGRGYWDLERDPIDVKEVHPWKEYIAGEAGVERHFGPGSHPGTGTDQDVHGGDQPALFDVPEGQEGRAPEPAEQALRPALARALREVPPNSPFSWTSPHGEFLKGAFRDDKDVVSLHQVHAEVGTLLNAATGEGRGSVMLGEVLAEARRREMTEFHINAASESGRGLLNRFERWGLIEPHETYIDIGGVSEDTATWKLPDMTPSEVRHRVERGLEEEGQTEVLTLRHQGPGPHPGTGTPQAAHGPGKSDYAYAGEIGTSEFDAAMKRVDGEFVWDPDLSGASPWLMPDGHLTAGRLGVHEASIITVIEEMGIDRPYGVAEDFHKAMIAAIERGYIRVHVVGHNIGKPQLVVDMHEGAMPTQAQRRTIGDLHTFMESSYDDFDFYYLIRKKDGGERAGNSIREAESDGIVSRHLGPGDHPSGSPQEVHAGDDRGSDSRVDTNSEAGRRKFRKKHSDYLSSVMDKLGEGSRLDGLDLANPIGIQAFAQEPSFDFIVAPDGRLFKVWDHDDLAASLFREATREIKVEAGRWSDQAGEFAMPASPKEVMLAFGFVRGTKFQMREVNFELETPVSAPVRQSIRDIMAVAGEDYGVGLDVNARREDRDEMLILQERDEIKSFLRRSELVDRHMGPGDHPSGSPQDVHAGKDGGGSIYEGWPEEEILEWEEKIADLPHEEAIFFSRESYQFRRTDLSHDTVRIPEFEQELLREENAAGRDTMLLHNHPSGTSFSFADIEFALRNRFDEMIVVGNGNRFRMSINGDVPDAYIWGGWDSETGKDVEGALNVALRVYEETTQGDSVEIPTGKLTGEDISRIRNLGLHAAWTAVEREYPEYFEYSEEKR